MGGKTYENINNDDNNDYRGIYQRQEGAIALLDMRVLYSGSTPAF